MPKFFVLASTFSVFLVYGDIALAQQKGTYENTTCEFGGRVGGVVFKNESAYPINVKLWHPDNNKIYTTKKVAGNTSVNFGINVGDDWGIQLGSSKIKCIGATATWAKDIFSVSSASFY